MTKIFKKKGLLVFFLLITSFSVFAVTDTVFSDIDNDGDYDIYLETVIENRAGTAFYNRTNASHIPLFPDLKKGHFVDFNDDGREDLYIVRDGAVNQLYLRNATLGNWNFTNYTNSVIGQRLRGLADSPTATVFADFTNDGNTDAFVNGELWLTTTSNFDFNATNRSNLDEMPDLVWIKAKDVNLDNLTDVVGTTIDGKLVVYLSMGDTNNDGAPEFYPAEVDMGLHYESNIVFTEIGNIETGLATNNTLNYYPFVNDTPPFILDKFQDFYLVKTNNTPNVLYTQLWPILPKPYSVINTTTFYIPELANMRPTEINNTRNGSMAIIADFDNNNVTDILIANHDNTSRIMLRNSSSWSQLFIDSDANFSNTSNIKLIETIDLNNDGELDFAVIDAQWVYLQETQGSGSEVSFPVGEDCFDEHFYTGGETDVDEFSEMEEITEGGKQLNSTFEQELAAITATLDATNINSPAVAEFSANPAAFAQSQEDSVGFITNELGGICLKIPDIGEFLLQGGNKDLEGEEPKKEPGPAPPAVVGPPTFGGPGGRISLITININPCDPNMGLSEVTIQTNVFLTALGDTFAGIPPPAGMTTLGIALRSRSTITEPFASAGVNSGEEYLMTHIGGPSVNQWSKAHIECIPKIMEIEIEDEYPDEILPLDIIPIPSTYATIRRRLEIIECICPPDRLYCSEDICKRPLQHVNCHCLPPPDDEKSPGLCAQRTACPLEPNSQITKILRDILLPEQETFDSDHLKWEEPDDKIGPIKPKTKPPVPEAPPKMGKPETLYNLMIEEVFVWKISYPEKEPIAAVAAETALTADSVSIDMAEMAREFVSPEATVKVKEEKISAVSITGAAISDVIKEEEFDNKEKETVEVEIQPVLSKNKEISLVSETPLDISAFMPTPEDEELNNLIDLVTVDVSDLLSEKDLALVKDELRDLGFEIMHEQGDLHSVSLICLSELSGKLDEVSEKQGLIPSGKAENAIDDISNLLAGIESPSDIADRKDKLLSNIGIVENYGNEIKPFNSLKDVLNEFKSEKQDLTGFNYNNYVKLKEIKELARGLDDKKLNNELKKLDDLIYSDKIDKTRKAFKEFAYSYEDVLLEQYNKKIDSALSDFKESVELRDYDKLILAADFINQFVKENKGNNKFVRLLQSMEDSLLSDKNLNKKEFREDFDKLRELIDIDAKSIPELRSLSDELDEKVFSKDIDAALETISDMKKQSKGNCRISNSQPIVYEYYTQDFELENKKIQQKMEKASETVSELFTIVAKLMGQVDDEDEDYDLSDLKFEMHDKIKSSSSFFFFKNQYFEDLKLLFKLSPTYAYLKELRDAIFSISEELNSLDVIKPEQIAYFNDRLDKILAGINSLRVVLLSQSGQNPNVALSPFMTGAIDEGMLDLRVSDKAHALTADIMSRVENNIPVSEAAFAADILAETFEKEIPEVKDITEPFFEKFELKKKIAFAKEDLKKELKEDEIKEQEKKLEDIKKEIVVKTEERKLEQELAAVSAKIVEVAVEEPEEEVEEEKVEEKIEEEKEEVPEEKKKKKKEEEFSKEEKAEMERLYNKGMYEFKNENYKEAVKNFGEYLRINPLNEDVLWHTADSLEKVDEHYLSTKTAEAVQKVENWEEYVEALDEVEENAKETLAKFISEPMEKIKAPSSRFIEPAAYVLFDMTDCFTKPLQEFVVKGQIYTFYGVKEEVDEQGAVKYFIEAAPKDEIETVTFEIPELIDTLKDQIGFCKVPEIEKEKKPKPTPTNDEFAQALENEKARLSKTPEGVMQVCMDVEADVSELASILDVQKTSVEVCTPYDAVAALTEVKKEPDIKPFEEMKFPSLEPDFTLLKQSNVRENLYDVYKITHVLTIIGDYELASGESKLFVLGENLESSVKVRRKVSREFLDTLEKIDYTPPTKCTFEGGTVSCTQFDACVIDKGKLTCTKSFSEEDCIENDEGELICEGFTDCKKQGEVIICEQKLKEDCTFGRDAEGNIVVEQCEGFAKGECTINEKGEIECESTDVEIPSDCKRVGLDEFDLMCEGYAGASCKLLDSGKVYCKESSKLPDGCSEKDGKFVCEDPVLQEKLKDCVIDTKTGEFSCGEGDLEWFFEDGELKTRPKPKFSNNPGDDCVYVDDKFICGEGLPELRNIPHGCILVNDVLDCYYDPKLPVNCEYKDNVLECKGYERGACGYKTNDKGEEEFSCVQADIIDFPEGCTISGCEGYSASECGFSNGEYVCEHAEKLSFPKGCDFDSSSNKVLCGSAELDLPENCVSTSKGVKCNNRPCHYIYGNLVCETR